MILPEKPPASPESRLLAHGRGQHVNLEALTEKVYRLLLEDLRLQRMRRARPER